MATAWGEQWQAERKRAQIAWAREERVFGHHPNRYRDRDDAASEGANAGGARSPKAVA